MSETIWRATDADGDCFTYIGGAMPVLKGDAYEPQRGTCTHYDGEVNKPTPGECWEMTVTRKGEQPSGEAWERLTKERDEALRELANERASCGHVTTEQINVIAELRAKLERPEMPEVVRSLIGDIIREVPGRFSQAIAAVEAHYAPPFKFEVGGVYEASDNGNRWIVRHVWPSGEFIATYDGPLISSVTFHKNGQAISAAWSLVNRLR